MTAGLRILNDLANVQVDETYRNMHLRTKTVATSGSSRVVGINMNNPIFALLSTFDISVSSQLRKEFANQSKWWYEQPVAGGQSVEIYAFDIGAPLATELFGLRVRDASGNVVFHSGGKPLVVVGIITHSKNTSTTYNYVAGRRYAIIPCAPHRGYSFRSFTGGVVITASNLTSTAPTAKFLVVDVTTY